MKRISQVSTSPSSSTTGYLVTVHTSCQCVGVMTIRIHRQMFSHQNKITIKIYIWLFISLRERWMCVCSIVNFEMCDCKLLDMVQKPFEMMGLILKILNRITQEDEDFETHITHLNKVFRSLVWNIFSFEIVFWNFVSV